ncbi:MAG: YbgA family protein [Vicinamibacterales bacterium]
MRSSSQKKTSGRIRIGVSACLLGDEVRYDGGHKRDAFLTQTLGPLVEWVKVCPEVESGMPTPRESIRLVDEDGVIRLRTVGTGVDHTASMTAYATARVVALDAADLCGYVLKNNSPSCGMTRVKVYGGNGPPSKSGVGVFAAALMERFPHLPVEEEGRLTDARLRENFIERVFAFRRLRDLFEARWTVGDLVLFHTAHKLVLLAHSTPAYTRLGRLVAGAKSSDRAAVRARYTAGFMEALTAIATPQRHTNVLQHMAGYFKKALDAASKAELLNVIEDYRLGLLPLVVPVTLLRHHVRIHDIKYLAGQIYLAPHPKELMLRNHV